MTISDVLFSLQNQKIISLASQMLTTEMGAVRCFYLNSYKISCQNSK